MRLSTKGRYGVKALVELALQQQDAPVALHTIAKRQGLSESYLEQLMGPLRKAGLVRSVRGAQGGYSLGRDPSEITVGDILRVLEGPLAPTDCVGEAEFEHCGRAEGCITRSVWLRVQDSIEDVVDSITLADLCAEARGEKD